MSRSKISASSLAQGISLFSKTEYAAAITLAALLILVQGSSGVATAIAIIGTAAYLRKKASDELERAARNMRNNNSARYADKNEVDHRFAVTKRRLTRLEASGKVFGSLTDDEYFARNAAAHLECDGYIWGCGIAIWSFPDRDTLSYEDSTSIREFLGGKGCEFLDRLDASRPYVWSS